MIFMVKLRVRKREMRFKTIIRNINLLNMILILVLGSFAAYRISPLLAVKMKYALPPAKKMEAKSEGKASQPQIPSITEYAVISEQNLFHPERRIPPEKKEEAVLPKPDFVLYGTLISDDVKLAYLEDLKAPRSTAGRGKRLTSMKKGDSMSGFTLKEIETEKVVMARGEEQIVVPINDPAHPKDRKETGIATESKQPQAGKSPTSPQKQKEPRTAVTGRTPSPPRAFTPQATQNVPTSVQESSSPTVGRGIKGAPQGMGSSAPQVDPATNRTPGGFLYDRFK